MDYVPHTPGEQKEMLKVIGVGDLEDLFADIPAKYRLGGLLNLPPPLSEQEIWEHMGRLAARNRLPGATLTGAGAYHHYIPAVVSHVVGRSEFYTAYTPYQAEISQGILQAIYEYQTMITRLTGTQVANASMYDGATAMAEAAVLSAKSLGRSRLLVGRSVHPEYRKVVGTYAWANGYACEEIPFGATGRLEQAALRELLDDKTAAVLVQSPNFFGVIEDIGPLADLAHSRGALLVAGFTDPTSLGILKAPGDSGADFVVGEGQSFGNPMNYGGPYLGILASTEAFMRKIPGRLVGATVDREGRRGYVLTLQTREQHIRREKATSNICSNEALCMLAAAVYLACLGKNLKRLAALNVWKANYLKEALSALPGWRPLFTGPVYNEFAMSCPDAGAANRRLEKAGFTGGYDLSKDYPELGGGILFCATEMLRREDMDKAVSLLK
ncbi:MAG: aminomethyl-transferring glycine dehydrogenase subunit GcvPA [Syntrophaceae bacterium]|nr:aminomethyl-transferring glycine dehydrogenase subunit GcvPA [Syntrophaceae bacterium]